MDKEEIIRRLKKLSKHAVHIAGEPSFVMSLDDGIALNEAVRLLKEHETHWISVKDRMPDSKWVDYLVATELCDGTIGLNVAWLYDDDGGWASTDGAIREGREVVTHWMPLPEHPKESR